MNNLFNELQANHHDLLERYQKDSNSKELVNDVKEHITRAMWGISKISNNRKRNQIRANIRFWSNYLYIKTGTYYKVSLMPPIMNKRFLRRRRFREILIYSFVIIILGGVIVAWITQIR